MQTLESHLGTATAKIKSETLAKSDKFETFFQKGRKLLQSGEANQSWASVQTLAKVQTELFMEAVRDPKSPKHLESLLTYRDSYGYDSANVNRTFVDKVSAEIKADNPIDLMEDPQYEANLFNRLRPQGYKATRETLAWFDILKDNLKKSRDMFGYGKDKCLDKQVIQDFQNKYGQPGLFGLPEPK